ncbi:MAG: protoheme IX farnesyltransferase [Streptosporangiaceae bacterium]|nr:protoheme IX farnesyltransferase [Streptosporangiaceae bacterium]MBV9854133.1 protoheme IX farnesyltransferase [Streptosporangiaceae bacterium]
MSVANVRPAPASADRTGAPLPPLARLAETTRAYVALCKPRIVELLLVTAVPTLFLAYRGLPSLLVTTVVVVGGALAAGSANALNCYIDRDIDEVMRRTSRRPLVRRTVSPRSALIFGLVLGVVSVAVFAVATNLLAAGLTLAAIVYYVVVYTILLKRRTPQSTLWGGACGAAPVLIAWAAAKGALSAAPLLLFAVVFFWQPPHFWALAMKFRDDYRRAGIPMLPVVASGRRVLAETVADSWLMVAASLALWPVAAGPVYGAIAIACGGAFLWEVHRLYGQSRRGAEPHTMRLFHGSIVYLTLLFAAVAAGALIR